MKLMSIEQYLSTRYAKDSRPCRVTIIRLIKRGVIPGKKQGRRYYIDITAEERATGDPDVDILINNVLDG